MSTFGIYTDALFSKVIELKTSMNKFNKVCAFNIKREYMKLIYVCCDNKKLGIILHQVFKYSFYFVKISSLSDPMFSLIIFKICS